MAICLSNDLAVGIDDLRRAMRDELAVGACDALMPDDRGQKALMISRNTDANGVFEIKAAPGSYHLYAWMELDGAAYRNEEFMKKCDDRGTAVRIDKDGKVLDNPPLTEGQPRRQYGR